MTDAQFIQVEQLRIGLFVHLDLGWMDHPFTTSNFKIKDKTQIKKIKDIGLNKLRYDPYRSDCSPLPLEEEVTTEADKAINEKEKKLQDDLDSPTIITNPPATSARVTALTASIEASEKKFMVAGQSVKSINQHLATSPKPSLEQANTVINELLETVLMEGDVVIHAMEGSRISDSDYEHSLNVTVLSMMLAKVLDISKEDLRLLGLSAMMHDVGKSEISNAVLNQKGELSERAMAHYKQHVEFGRQIIKNAGLPARVGRIVYEHHEYADGSGYPRGVTIDALDPLSNIIIICNQFDNLCNPINVHDAKTPYETLRWMFAMQQRKFHGEILKRFIKCIGVYPPNSIVQLSNDDYGIVISVNPQQPLRPFIRIISNTIDEDDPSSIIDLRAETSISIIACVKQNALPPSVSRLIKPRKKTAYFIDNEQSKINH